MKVIALQASPHRGNTFRRVEKLGEALKEKGSIEFEHIELRKLNLKPCLGCFSCFLNGEESCPLQDDAPALLQKLDEADAVVFATPVYSMHVSYLMKQFVDRFAFIFHRPRFFGKYAIGLAVTGGIGLKEALDYVKMFSGTWGFKYLDELRFVDPPRDSSLIAFAPEKDRTEFVVDKLISVVSRGGERTPTVKELLHFHIMRAVYCRMKKYLPFDYEYWSSKGWLNRKCCYFTSVRGSCLKSLFPRIAAFFMGRMMDSRIKGIEKTRKVQ